MEIITALLTGRVPKSETHVLSLFTTNISRNKNQNIDTSKECESPHVYIHKPIPCLQTIFFINTKGVFFCLFARYFLFLKKNCYRVKESNRLFEFVVTL